ncbi:MAG: tRNA (5-methylaminomethyl-2-thiouridine)(34)-methyltransferase MnmD [Myxococcales bacterium]|nr:tRNA (5-methylaminomethyl-2-thiouridine)(34)-methyltransferase MnmD [Myxococcales bacterium]MCB9644781.1 tRNA (5-methylaminomethyl-2-thiouridine)(34)-methyltransferase MnmD [Myxococcales bacterium]
MTDRPSVSLIETQDGSWTLFHEMLGVHYRSLFGALTESRYVFLEGCQLPQKTGDWCVLELGFGGGMNFLQTALAARLLGRRLVFHTMEWAPVDPAILAQLHQQMPQEIDSFSLLAQKVVASALSEDREVHVASTSDGRVQLHLYPKAWQDAAVPVGLAAHAIFHDPFGPRVNPEGWSLPCFSWMRARIADDGILATYSAATQVRTALAGAGFVLAKAPGLGRKREITLASPSEAALSMYSLLPTERYRQRAQDLL